MTTAMCSGDGVVRVPSRAAGDRLAAMCDSSGGESRGRGGIACVLA
jgi:hypothetical protein